MLFEEARKEARALDDYFNEHKQLKGPLHGVPCSFKDACELISDRQCLDRSTHATPQDDISGYDSCMGHTSLANKPAASDAEVRARGRLQSRLRTLFASACGHRAPRRRHSVRQDQPVTDDDVLRVRKPHLGS